MEKKLCSFCQGKLIGIIKSKRYTVDNVEYTVPNVKVLRCNHCSQEFITEDVHDYVLDYIEAAENNKIYSLIN